jgi:hypothetical protein
LLEIGLRFDALGSRACLIDFFLEEGEYRVLEAAVELFDAILQQAHGRGEAAGARIVLSPAALMAASFLVRTIGELEAEHSKDF